MKRLPARHVLAARLDAMAEFRSASYAANYFFGECLFFADWQLLPAQATATDSTRATRAEVRP